MQVLKVFNKLDNIDHLKLCSFLINATKRNNGSSEGIVMAKSATFFLRKSCFHSVEQTSRDNS